MPPHDASTLPPGCSIVHGTGATVKQPFADVALSMHGLDPGGAQRSFGGQFGFIEFSTDFRLPRHVHIAPAPGTVIDGDGDGSGGRRPVHLVEQRFVAERIVVLNGVALVELSGRIYVIPPKSLVTIAAGVPHTWTACPADVVLPPAEALPGSTSAQPEQVTSTSAFLMLYEYEAPTAFFSTAQTATLTHVGEYERCDDLDSMRIAKFTASEVKQRCYFCWDSSIVKQTE